MNDNDGHYYKPSGTKQASELQDDRKPHKKRTFRDEEGFNKPPAEQRRRITLEEARLEARRRSNRLSAQRARDRTKMTIRELERGQAKLQAANHALCIKLEEALLQNQLLRRVMKEQALESSALQRMLAEHRISKQGEQESPRSSSRTASSPLLELVKAAEDVAYEPPVFERAHHQGGRDTLTSIHPPAEAQGISVDEQIEYLQKEIKALKKEALSYHQC